MPIGTSDGQYFDDIYHMSQEGYGIEPTLRITVNKYETKLDDFEESAFQNWKQQNAPEDSGEDYDYRGAYKAGIAADPATGHWPDTYKKPNHPTFSVESQYANDRPDLAGHWDGETYVPPSDPFTTAAQRTQQSVQGRDKTGRQQGIITQLLDSVGTGTAKFLESAGRDSARALSTPKNMVDAAMSGDRERMANASAEFTGDMLFNWNPQGKQGTLGTFGGIGSKQLDLGQIKNELGQWTVVKGSLLEKSLIAQQMDEEGKGVKEIFEKTGWFKGVDDQWRYEIDDSKAYLTDRLRETYDSQLARSRWRSQNELTYNEAAKVFKDSGYSLNVKWGTGSRPNEYTVHRWGKSDEGLIDRDQLPGRLRILLRRMDESEKEQLSKGLRGWTKIEAAEPEPIYEIDLSKGTVYLNDILDHPALFEAYPELKKIKLTPNMFDMKDIGGYFHSSDNTMYIKEATLDRLLSVVLHEAQHGIQKIENFARGTNPDATLQGTTGLTMKEWKRKSDKVSADLFQTIKIIESLGYDAQQITIGALAKVAGNGKNVDPVQAQAGKSVKSLLQSQRDSSGDYFRIAEIKEAYKKFAKEQPIFADLLERDTRLGTGLDSMKADAEKKYMHFAGEVEARVVQERHKMTPEQKRNTDPRKSSDIDEDVPLIVHQKESVGAVSDDNVRQLRVPANDNTPKPNLDALDKALRENFHENITKPFQESIKQLDQLKEAGERMVKNYSETEVARYNKLGRSISGKDWQDIKFDPDRQTAAQKLRPSYETALRTQKVEHWHNFINKAEEDGGALILSYEGWKSRAEKEGHRGIFGPNVHMAAKAASIEKGKPAIIRAGNEASGYKYWVYIDGKKVFMDLMRDKHLPK